MNVGREKYLVARRNNDGGEYEWADEDEGRNEDEDKGEDEGRRMSVREARYSRESGF